LAPIQRRSPSTSSCARCHFLDYRLSATPTPTREIAYVLEELRKVRAERDLRPLVILGASGAGKSSLLKAGIIPRLRREAPAWLPLRAFRPGADPLLNFAEALARTFADFGPSEAHGVIRDRLMGAWSKAERADRGDLTPAGLAVLEAALEAEAQTLRNAADRPNASILISVDQAEEMARADGESGEALADGGGREAHEPRRCWPRPPLSSVWRCEEAA
jgi:hypothetical protein